MNPRRTLRGPSRSMRQWPALDGAAGCALSAALTGFAVAAWCASSTEPTVTTPRQRASRAVKYFLGSQRHGLQKSVLPQPAIGASATVGPPHPPLLTPMVVTPLSNPSRDPVPCVLAISSARVIRFLATDRKSVV